LTELIEKLATRVAEDESFSATADQLFGAYVSSLIGSSKRLDRQDVKKLILTAQIFYKSDDQELRNEGAIILT